MTAFASGRLAGVNVFHHSPRDSVTLEHPCRLYRPGPRDETSPPWIAARSPGGEGDGAGMMGPGRSVYAMLRRTGREDLPRTRRFGHGKRWPGTGRRSPACFRDARTEFF